MYQEVFAIVAAAVSGVSLWMLFEARGRAKRAMLLTIETNEALTVAKAEADRRDASATRALAELQTRLDESQKARERLENEVKAARATLVRLQDRFGLSRSGEYTDEELTRAAAKERHTRALGADIGAMFSDARRRGMI